jgi:membrane protein
VRILREQIEEARARHRSVDIGVATVERDSEIGGSLLAGALAYRLFVFLLPFAVFLVVGLGLYADATDRSTAAVADDLGLTQVVAREIAGAANDSARWWVLIASVPILAYAIGQLFRSVSIVHALAYEGSGRAVKIKPRSIGLFGLAVVGQVAVSNVAGALSADSVLGGVLGVVFAVAAVAGLWLGVSQLFPHGASSVTERLPGALLYGVGNLAIFLFNTLFVGWLIEERHDSYGALGVAAALLFSMYLIGRLIVTSAVLNATIARRAAAAGSE